MSEITLVLQSIGRGENEASEKLLPMVYDELRRLAAARMAGAAISTGLSPGLLPSSQIFTPPSRMVTRPVASRWVVLMPILP